MIKISIAALTTVALSFSTFPTPVSHALLHIEPTDLHKAWADYWEMSLQLQPWREFPYQKCFERAANVHQLPVTLLLAVARGESDFDPSVRSKAGAWGLMQIAWPHTARELNIQSLSALKNPCTNVDGGARYLQTLLEKYQGNLHRAVAAYNYGPKRIPIKGKIPSGARRYSRYIYRQLLYVTGAY